MELFPLKPTEQEQFREDFQEKEREIQRYITVYLSAFAVVVGWMIGPQSKGALDMALGNSGYNIFGWYALVLVNITFSCFLTYKSIIIHEIMQFVTYLSPRKSGFLLWERWRRSRHGATRRIRAVYTITISAPPVLVSFLIMGLVWWLLHANPENLAERANRARLEVTTTVPTSSEPGGNTIAVPAAGSSLFPAATLIETKRVGELLDAQELRVTLNRAYVAWWVFAAIHLLPIWFYFENVIPTGRRWTHISNLRPELPNFRELPRPAFLDSTPKAVAPEKEGRTAGSSSVSRDEEQSDRGEVRFVDGHKTSRQQSTSVSTFIQSVVGYGILALLARLVIRNGSTNPEDR